MKSTSKACLWKYNYASPERVPTYLHTYLAVYYALKKLFYRARVMEVCYLFCSMEL